MDLRIAWSSAGGVVGALTATNAVAWAVGAGSADSPLPWWPAIVFAVLAALGLATMVTALLRVWPFDSLGRSATEVLDGCIRQGREARDRIIYDELDVVPSNVRHS
jgi:hypothetical protein